MGWYVLRSGSKILRISIMACNLNSFYILIEGFYDLGAIGSEVLG